METTEKNRIIDLSDRMYKLMLSVIGLVAVFVIGQAVFQFRSLPQNYPREISVSGEGRVFAKPDLAIVSFGVITQAKKSQEAIDLNNDKMNETIEAIKNLGVEDKDIQTTLYSLYPEYNPELVFFGDSSVPRNEIVGYTLNQQIQVKIRDFSKISDILDAATDKGANTVGNLQFTLDDPEKARTQAREKAIAKAKEKTAFIFSQTGLRMDKLINIYEDFSGCISGFCPYSGSTGPMLAESSAPKIEAGETEISVKVTLVYRIK